MGNLLCRNASRSTTLDLEAGASLSIAHSITRAATYTDTVRRKCVGCDIPITEDIDLPCACIRRDCFGVICSEECYEVNSAVHRRNTAGTVERKGVARDEAGMMGDIWATGEA